MKYILVGILVSFFLWLYHGKWPKRARWRLKVDRTCHFHDYSEEKAPFPCDDKLPPAKMSRYRCLFYGYSMKNDPQYKLTRFCTSVLGRIQIRRPSKTASPALCLFTKLALFGHLVGWRVFRNGKQRLFNSFPYVGALSMAISMKQRQVMAEGWSNVPFPRL